MLSPASTHYLIHLHYPHIVYSVIGNVFKWEAAVNELVPFKFVFAAYPNVTNR